MIKNQDVCERCGHHRVYDCRTKTRYCQNCRVNPVRYNHKERVLDKMRIKKLMSQQKVPMVEKDIVRKIKAKRFLMDKDRFLLEEIYYKYNVDKIKEKNKTLGEFG